MRRTVFAVLLLATNGNGPPNHSVKQSANADATTIIQQFENELKSDLTKDGIDGSISACIVKENKVIWSMALGYADRDNRIAADTSTIYRIGSISKSFTAFLMMRLVEEKIIKLNDPVESYFPEIKRIKGYSNSTKITFSQLASHTSGLSMEPRSINAKSGPIEDWERKLIASLPTTYFESQPGTKFSYSNIGYGILGLALSRAARKPFIELIQNTIFVPLKMTKTFYRVPDELKATLAVGMAGGPSETIDTDLPKKEHQGRGYAVPNGGIYSTPNDLAKFMICNLGFNPILDKESLETMQTEKDPEGHKYGLGFMIFHADPINIVGHNGSIPGYEAEFVFEKESKYGVIVLRNYNHGAMDLEKATFNLLNKLRRLKK